MKSESGIPGTLEQVPDNGIRVSSRMESESGTPIAEKVLFWEEQDRINQILIPRIVRQGELLTKHIAEHDDLPKLFSSSIADGLAKQSRQFKAELSSATTALNEAHSKALRQATSEHAQLVRHELEAALSRLQEHNQRRFNRTRNRLTAITVIAVVVAIASALSAWG